MHSNGYSNGAVKAQEVQLPPNNTDAEAALLGGLLIDPDMFYEVSDSLEPEFFFLGRHGAIYKAIADMHREGVAVDFVTLSEVLEARGESETGYLVDLYNAVPTAVNTPHYARIVRALALRRRLIQAAGKVANAAYDESTAIDDVIGSSEAAIFAVTETAVTQGVESAKHGLSRIYDLVTERQESGGMMVGLPTGLHDLDALLRGLHKGDLYIIAARPGMGKSVLERVISLNTARMGKRVALFNLEMPAEQIWMRTISVETGIPLINIREGRMSPGELPVFNEAVGRISQLKMWVDDTPGLTISQLTAKCRRLHAEHGLDLITVDYLQLMQGDGQNREQEVGSISRGLKGLAKRLNVPVVALAQLSRSVESRQDKHPQLSDLRDSGQIEQDSDVVMFLYRDEYYKPQETEKPNIMEVEVAKSRNGPPGQVELYWSGKSTKVTNLARQEIVL